MHQKYIVDRDIQDSVMDGIFIKIQDALENYLKQHALGRVHSVNIKIASNLY